MNNIGVHIVADIYSIEQLGKDFLINTIEKAIELSNMTVLDKKIYDFDKLDAFTAVWLLSESHFTIHTYPELNYLSIDCYTCGSSAKPNSAVGFMLDSINVKSANVRILQRG